MLRSRATSASLLVTRCFGLFYFSISHSPHLVLSHRQHGSVVCFFFFSSRRRHTRFKCDWSSDVCSSDSSELQSHLNLVCRLLLDWSSDGSEEHTSELQSHLNFVCRLLLEKKKQDSTSIIDETSASSYVT